ncbi:hypothetical protein ACFFIX_21840 [Metabacillus herbersteinensis]|uniref:Uncharacterized protein n=1 Tax=Metabacillus herbersteinensis TaxID=283816 RepID=A0ABV6GJX5_9BACI
MEMEGFIDSFLTEVQHASAEMFPTYVDSFTNLWEHEFGSLHGLPQDVNDLVASRAIEYGLME